MQEESTSARAGAIATDWYLLGRVRSFDEIQAAIDGLTPKGGARLSRRVPDAGTSRSSRSARSRWRFRPEFRLTSKPESTCLRTRIRLSPSRTRRLRPFVVRLHLRRHCLAGGGHCLGFLLPGIRLMALPSAPPPERPDDHRRNQSRSALGRRWASSSAPARATRPRPSPASRTSSNT